MQQHHRGKGKGQDGYLAAEDADGLAEPQAPEPSVTDQALAVRPLVGTARTVPCLAVGRAVSRAVSGRVRLRSPIEYYQLVEELSTGYAERVAKRSTHAAGRSRRDRRPGRPAARPRCRKPGLWPTLCDFGSFVYASTMRSPTSELAVSLGERPATVLHHVRTLVATGFLTEEAWRRGPRGSTEKPYRATGKSAQLDQAMSGGDRLRLCSRRWQPRSTRPARMRSSRGSGCQCGSVQTNSTELLGQIRALIASYPGPEAYMGSHDAEGDPYALLVVLHRRRLPVGVPAPD